MFFLFRREIAQIINVKLATVKIFLEEILVKVKVKEKIMVLIEENE